MRVLALCKWDWANSVHRYTECLRMLGLDVVAFKGEIHRFNYPQQLALHTGLIRAQLTNNYPIMLSCHELKKYAEEADIVHMFASTYIDTGVDYTQKKVIIQHSGTTFRMEPERCNQVFNQIVDYTIMQFPTLLNQGAKNEVLIYYPVDTKYLQSDYRRRNSNKLIVEHFPSAGETKGTANINVTSEELKKKYNHRFEFELEMDEMQRNVDWYWNINRVRNCDIYIETICPMLRGKPFGAWGNSALESAALGKVVITNSMPEHQELYKQEYSDINELVIANDMQELDDRLYELSQLSDKEIQDKREKTREWVVANHSMEVTAKRLFDKVYKHLI